MTSIIGYVRVSTNEQTVENQKQQIADAGYQVSKWYCDEATSGSVKAAERKGFGDLLAYIREGDTLIVVGIDRLGRNTIDVLSTVETLRAKGVKVISLREGFDLSTPVGKLMLTMMAGLASLEKDLIAERRTAGIKRAQSEGVHCGRPNKVTPEQVQELISCGLSPKDIQKELGISKATFYRLK
ncbi:TPA: recombinase family protein [Klebsiella pneumoniae]|uniref:recombinase family protein n=1 Tax=Enterobacteriaceae TaxID=543 RepID=UPI000E2EA844|nr:MULTISPECIES: recombinase family protein [Enterobacteriaceae]HDG8026478.1 recombinase family protein [Klebsiella variicola]HDS9475592.1 recombinase family protein [Klebsiella pneumoniae subsp. pneumoniae]RFB00800.1 multiple promoter invertase [Escherichia coli]HBS6121990.1 recombinase family protein [Klebsiella pneumoniae]HDS9499137.1 recombinase family protein [Klebsiella pneumoniae subsp. pneumoniae]